MIRVRFARRGDTCVLHAVGHAGYGPRGADVVCAAVSAAVGMLLAGLEACEVRELTVSRGEGEVYLSFGGAEGEALWRACRVYLEALARAYPENVEVRPSGELR